MRGELRGAAKSFALYLFGLAIIAGLYFSGGYFGLTQAAYAAISFAVVPERTDKTRLSIVTANAREIRAALAKPIAGPEPLGPVREKAANALGGPKIVAQQAIKPKMSREAKQAFASDNFAASSTAYAYSDSYDRHRPQ